MLRTVLARAPLTTRSSIALLACSLLSAFAHGYLGAFALAPCSSSIWTALPGLLLHSLAFGSLLHWLITCLSLICSALVCERELGAMLVVSLWVGCSLLGGAAYLLAATNCLPFVGPSAFAWGFAGAALTVIVLRWNRAHWLEKAYAAVVLVGLLTLLQVEAAVAALQVTGLLLGAASAYLVHRQRHKNCSPGPNTAA